MGLKTTWTVQGIGLHEEAVNGNGWNEGEGGSGLPSNRLNEYSFQPGAIWGVIVIIIMFNGKVGHKGSRKPHIGKVIRYRTISTLVRL